MPDKWDSCRGVIADEHQTCVSNGKGCSANGQIRGRVPPPKDSERQSTPHDSFCKCNLRSKCEHEVFRAVLSLGMWTGVALSHLPLLCVVKCSGNADSQQRKQPKLQGPPRPAHSNGLSVCSSPTAVVVPLHGPPVSKCNAVAAPAGLLANLLCLLAGACRVAAERRAPATCTCGWCHCAIPQACPLRLGSAAQHSL